MLGLTILCVSSHSRAQHIMAMEPGRSPEAEKTSRRFVDLGNGEKKIIQFPGTRSGRLLIQRTDGLVRFDTNDDARIDDRDASGTRAGSNRAIQLPIIVGETEIRIELIVHEVSEDTVVFGSRTALVGKTSKMEIQLIDRLMNGRFAYYGLNLIQISSRRAPPAPNASAEVTPASRPEPMALNGSICYEDRLYTVDVRQGGMSLALGRYEGEVATVELRPTVKAERCFIRLTDVNDRRTMVRLEQGMKKMCPAGMYRIEHAIFQFSEVPGCASPIGIGKTIDGSGNTLKSTPFPSPKTRSVVEIEPGHNTLTPGPPFSTDTTADVWLGKKGVFQIRKVCLVGSAGERYDAAASLHGTVRSVIRSDEWLWRKSFEFKEFNRQAMGKIPEPAWENGDIRLETDSPVLGRLAWVVSIPGEAGREKSEDDFRGLAKCAEKLRDEPTACEIYEAGLATYPGSKVLLASYAMVLSAAKSEAIRDPARAVEMAETAAGLYDRNRYSLLVLARALRSNGQPEEALEVINEARQSHRSFYRKALQEEATKCEAAIEAAPPSDGSAAASKSEGDASP